MRQSGLLVLGGYLTISAAAAGCTFKTHANISSSGGNIGGDGTGGSTVSNYDGAVFNPDAAREYVSSAEDALIAPTVDANCQNQPFSAEALPPDLLIVLDRSGSMNQDSTGMMCRGAACAGTSKWDQMTAAINQVVAMTETTVNWGIKFFGNDNSCGVVDGATVPPAPSNAMAIATAIADPVNKPGSNTPTAAGELSAGKYLATLIDPNPKFILMATDGQPNCAGGVANTTDDMATIDAVTAVKTMGFPTFVIGIATTGSTADTTLNSMAMNGGYPLATATPQYYSVTTTANLVAALGAIQTITKGMCTYQLRTPEGNADLTKVTVTVDGNPSVKDDPNGWHYDPAMTSITFGGDTCAQLMAGTLKSVQVLYGCKLDIVR